MYDILVVGAGPAGSYFANLASRAGYKVIQIDLKKEIGIPNHCSGLVNKRILKYSGDELIIDEPKNAYIITPAGTIELKNRDMIVIDRIGLDKKLNEEALSEGTELHLESRLFEFKQRNDHIDIYYQHRDKVEKIEARYLVGADGPASLIRKKLGLDQPKLLPSIQFDLNKTMNDVNIWLDRSKIRDFFAWEVPQGNSSELGIAGTYNIDFPKSFIRDNRTIFKKRGGLIPLGRSVLGYDHVFLLGDAAVANKATSGGGLFGAFMSSEYLFESLGEENILESYKYRWKKGFGKDIKDSFRLRKIMDKYEKYYSTWVQVAKISRKYLNKVGDVDYPQISALALFDISLLYGPFLIRNFISDLTQIRNYSI